MEGTLKALNIGAKMLTRRCKAIGDILLATEEAAKILAGNKLTTKMLRLQTKYMGTRKTRITLHGVLMYITNNLFILWAAGVGYPQSRASRALPSVLVTLTWPKFSEIPNIMTCSGRNIFFESSSGVWISCRKA